MTLHIKQSVCAAALLALAACDAEVATREGEVDPGNTPNTEANGVLLNSFRLNSFRLNSFRLNSFRLNGDPGTDDFIEIADIDLPFKGEVEFSWVEGSSLIVQTEDGDVYGGGALEGTKIAFTVQENEVETVREVRIAEVTPLTKGSDVMLYDLEIREAIEPGDDDKKKDKKDKFGAWEPLCVDSEGAAVPAVLLTDIWDPDTGDKLTPAPSDAVTFACVDAALGKCAVWGYRPWASLDADTDLADYHQACTRMVRADYCGEGISHTTEGTAIHVLDQIGIELLDLDLDFAVEAEWGPDGAVCLNPENTRLPDQDITCGLPTCGPVDFASGGLIQSGKLLDWQ